MVYSSYCRLATAEASQLDKEARTQVPNYQVCYAESGDGVNWRKPDLDLIPWQGRGPTNIVFAGKNRAIKGSVIANPDPDDSTRRYLMAYSDKDSSGEAAKRFVASSPDLIHWAKDPACGATESVSDGGDKLVWDPLSETWYRYIRSRLLAVDKKSAPALTNVNIKRRKSVMTSKDLKSSTFPTSVLFPDELDPAPNTMDSWCVFKHGSHFIGILALMNEKSNEGKTDL